jgi:hypothetical protein
MSLRDQMAVDACAILNTDELGERASWTPYSQTSGITRTVRLIEQPERQTIRRAHVWTQHNGTSTTQGDTFRVKRGNVTTTWRVLYTDPAETALQRSYCHLQLSDTLTVVRKPKYKRASGADVSAPEPSGTSYRCHWFQSSAEVEIDNRRRVMAGEWYCLLETVPDLDTDLGILDSSGNAWRVERLDRGFSRVDLPYLVCFRADV